MRALRFHSGPRPPPLAEWRKTPLAGGQLVSLESLRGVEQEALEVLAAAPPKPNLRALWLVGDVGVPHRPAPAWARWWAAIFPAHPRLREVHLGWSGTRASTEGRLEGVLATDLERVIVEASAYELVELHAWWLARSPRFAFHAELRDARLAARLEYTRDALLLRAPPATRAAAEQQVREHWPAHRPMSPLHLVP
ncbi:MAG: hypothetical protein AB1730_08080 [Myxococcota bacterium]